MSKKKDKEWTQVIIYNSKDQPVSSFILAIGGSQSEVNFWVDRVMLEELRQRGKGFYAIATDWRDVPPDCKAGSCYYCLDWTDTGFGWNDI
jgi:hypothetical protein